MRTVGLVVLGLILGMILLSAAQSNPGPIRVQPPIVVGPGNGTQPQPGATAVVQPPSTGEDNLEIRVTSTRIYQPKYKEGHSAYRRPFVAPDVTDSWIYNGVSAELWYDSDGDGAYETLVAERSNGKSVTLARNGKYQVRGDDFNGGLELRRVPR